jgi:hypothetical protein
VVFSQLARVTVSSKQLLSVTPPSVQLVCNLTAGALSSMIANAPDEKAKHPINTTAGKIRNDFMSPPILGEFDEDCWCDDRMILFEIPARESLSAG